MSQHQAPLSIREKSKEDHLREVIPSIQDVPTLYRPVRDFVMVVPLPDQSKVGEIILPDRSHVVYNEGHVVALGPNCSPNIRIGDCIFWSQHSEYQMQIEKSKFVLLQENNVLMKISAQELQAGTEGGRNDSEAEEFHKNWKPKVRSQDYQPPSLPTKSPGVYHEE